MTRRDAPAITAAAPAKMAGGLSQRVAWMASSSIARRDTSFLILQVLTVVVGLVLFSLVLRPAGHVYDMPLTEDGYYSLSVARNLAAGHGMTIDGINLTNGFQPLFTVIELAPSCSRAATRCWRCGW